MRAAKHPIFFDPGRAWSSFALGANNLPWLRAKTFERLQRSLSYFLLDCQMNRTERRSQSRTIRRLMRLLRKPLHWRLRHAFFNCPLELWLSMVKRWLVVRRSLLTGQALGHELADIR